MTHLGGSERGFYFEDGADAEDWLAFDASDFELERRAYDEPDRFAEWVRWRDGTS